MLYFQNALPIASVEIVAAEGSFDEDIPEMEQQIQIYTNGQVANTGYTLRDIRAGQKIELQSPAKGSAFELKIKSVYKGKRYKDLAISDIVFYDGE